MERSTDVNNIRNQLLNLLLPTHEAAGAALTNVFFNLAGNPRGYEKFGFKILRTGEDQAEWTFERLKSLKYLQHAVNETFRAKPAIDTNTGMVLRDTSLPTIGGPTASKSSPVFVREDDTVTISFCLEKTLLLRPEQWDSLSAPQWSCLAFGGDARVCPKQNLALTEVAYTIIKVLHTFKTIENRDIVLDFREIYKITTDSGDGAKVSMILA